VARQALVQALLVSTTDAAEVDEEQIRAAYEHALARFERPERRASVHVLARVPKQATPEAEQAARELVTQLIGPLRDAADLDAFAGEARGRATPQLQVVAERIPAIDRHAGFARPYLDALFSLSEPGVVGQPVRTDYGWHAIRVTEIIPSERMPYDKAAEQLRAELLLRRRTKLVDELIGGARKQYGVEIPSTVGQTLAKLQL
jgi:parvulin-like peptidyl-prolyl isomerase